jgi:hypothetical protein
LRDRDPAGVAYEWNAHRDRVEKPGARGGQADKPVVDPIRRAARRWSAREAEPVQEAPKPEADNAKDLKEID